MPNSEAQNKAIRKVNWINAATIAYIKQLHPAIFQEAQDAARARWTAENPDDPWTGKPGRRIEWTPTTDSPASN